MRRRRSAALVTVVALAFGMVGCGSGSDDSGGTGGKDPRSQDEMAADRVAASKALLVLEDFPSDWEAEPRNDSDDEGPDLDAEMAECLGVDVSLFGDDAVEVKSDTFVNDNAEVEADISMQPTKADADKAVEAVRSPKARGCFEDAFGKVMEFSVQNPTEGDELPEGFELGEVTLDDLDFPDLGEYTRAFRLTVPVSAEGLSVEVFLDLVLIRVGRATGTLSFIDLGAPVDDSLAEKLARQFASRLPKD